MELKFGRHYFADLYLCQNQLWENTSRLMVEISKALPVNNLSLKVRTYEQPVILISADFEAVFILMQMFPAQKFLALDFFSWDPDFDPVHYSESLIEIFAPQVVAAETRLRAEHLN